MSVKLEVRGLMPVFLIDDAEWKDISRLTADDRTKQTPLKLEIRQQWTASIHVLRGIYKHSGKPFLMCFSYSIHNQPKGISSVGFALGGDSPLQVK